jgi:hypothetical protein
LACLRDPRPAAVRLTREQQHDPLAEVTWWKIEHGQVIPSGLQLVFDGDLPAIALSRVERPMKLSAFLELVAMVAITDGGGFARIGHSG